jgi:2-polyprenyl-6-methoxyphenol hydroxylase-like FAD-dependent oxidoreductase
MTGSRMGSRAVVVGGSMAGLYAARVLSERFEEVVVLDRDSLPSRPAFRRGVPQGRHAHALLLAGAQRLEAWFPGIGPELLGHGAVPLRRDQFHWYQAGGLRVRLRDDRRGALCSRPMLEHHVRARVAALPNVTLRHAAAEGALAAPDGGAVAVAGVRLAGGEALAADLVVDASGRAARSVRWLEQLGVAPPLLSAVHIDMAYATRILRRDPGDGRDWLVGVVIGDPPRSRMGVAFALEEDRWMVTLAGFHGDHPPTGDQGWADFAWTLPDPVLAELIADCEPLTELLPHRMTASQRRHVERQRRVAGGLVLLGDAVASFNPIYGQGMTSAALQAEALAAALDRCREVGPRFVRTYNRMAGQAVEAPWRLSVGGDFALPRTTGPRPRGTALLSPYMRRVLLAAQRDELVAGRFVEVTNLLRPPASLLAPAVALRALRAPRVRPAVPAQPVHEQEPAPVA